jgi:hypothetical protein
VAIALILHRYPGYIGLSVDHVDKRLGFVQQEFNLKGYEVRHMLTSFPFLAKLHEMKLRLDTFAFVEEMGFTMEQLKQLILADPSILKRSRSRSVANFDLLYNQVGLTNQDMVKFPQLFRATQYRLKTRAAYLKVLGRNQFDPNKPGYVPPGALGCGDDTEFVERYAKTSILDFNLFIKSTL